MPLKVEESAQKELIVQAGRLLLQTVTQDTTVQTTKCQQQQENVQQGIIACLGLLLLLLLMELLETSALHSLIVLLGLRRLFNVM